MLTADDSARIWANGQEVTSPVNNRIWYKADAYSFTGLRVLAVEITNYGGPTGLLASFSDGSVTSATSGWKCVAGTVQGGWHSTGFNDKSWPIARQYTQSTVNGISSKARWIATNEMNAKKTFCRRHFEAGLYNSNEIGIAFTETLFALHCHSVSITVACNLRSVSTSFKNIFVSSIKSLHVSKCKLKGIYLVCSKICKQNELRQLLCFVSFLSNLSLQSSRFENYRFFSLTFCSNFFLFLSVATYFSTQHFISSHLILFPFLQSSVWYAYCNFLDQNEF